MTQQEFIDHLSEIADRLAGAVEGESEADVMCAAAVLITEILGAPDAPPRSDVMDELLPLLRKLIGQWAAFNCRPLVAAEPTP